MDKLLKQIKNIGKSTGTEKYDYQKYLIFSGIIFTNGLFVLPAMKNLYLRLFSNYDAEMTHMCYFDIDLDGKRYARIDIGLYGKVAPENINNFLHLIAKSNPYKTYEDSKIFRLIPKYLVQMGDIQNNNGSGHLSYYDDNRYIKDEITPNVTFCEAGIVALANKGQDTNGSQFFITLDEIPNLNDKYTIIGQTVKGFESLKKLATICGNQEGTSTCNVKISKTGIYDYKDYVKNKNPKL